MPIGELKRFSSAVLALHDCREPARAAEALLEAMACLAEADVYTVNSLGPTSLAVSAATPEYTAEQMENFNAHLGDHPLMPIIATALQGGCAIGRWTDYTTLRAFRQTALYQDFFRPLGTSKQLALALSAGGDLAIGLVFNRGGRDYSDGDARLLKLLSPHVRGMLVELSSRLAVERAMRLEERFGPSSDTAIAGSGGEILQASPRVRALLRRYFEGEGAEMLPGALRSWLAGNPKPGRQIAFKGGQGRLVCTCSSAAVRVEQTGKLLDRDNSELTARCLTLVEENPGADRAAVNRLGLTPKEGEVLYWMAEGKRNSEIAIILGSKERTVDKHRENLFAKLGVENRTAAVATYWRERI